MKYDPAWKVLGFKSEEEYIEYQAKNERMAHEKGFANYYQYKLDKYLKDAYKLDEGYDLYKYIDAIAEYAKTHGRPRPGYHKDYIYTSTYLDLKSLNEIPRRCGIYLIRFVNLLRIKPHVDEFHDSVFNINLGTCAHMGILKVVEEGVGRLHGEEARKKYEKARIELEEAPIPVSLEEDDIYDMFSILVSYIFMNYTPDVFTDKPFANEPELIMSGTVFENFPPEVDPNNIRRIEDLTQKDVVRLLRIVNSFSRKDIVDKFITDVGDVEDLYDLFSLFVGYVFQDYKNANYFLDEPELSEDPKYEPWQISMFGKPTHKEYAYKPEACDYS